MKRKFYFFVLVVLCGLTGNMHAVAQDVPEPTVQWNFNDADNLMTPDKGSLTMTPALLGTRSVTLSTLEDAGIFQTDGPDGEKAILVPSTSALKVSRAEGAQASQSYTIMMDVMVEDASPYDGLLQTDPINGNDGDLFINKNQIGVGSIGGYFGKVRNNVWHRVVIAYRDGKNIVYLNGEKLVAADPDNNDRFKLQPFGFYLFCDEDGEKEDTYVSSVAFWEEALTDEQVSALGGFEVIIPTVEIGTASELLSFAERVNSGEEVNGILTADIALSDAWQMPIGIDGALFTGIFDGQGHKITGFQGIAEGKFGLFGYISNATVKNFSIEGSLTVTAGTGSGAIGYSSASRISNVHSSLNITVSEGNVHHVGGVVGSAQYKNRITGCTFSGTLDETAGNNDCFGGVIGYMAEDTVLYCANYGTVTYVVANGSVGGIAGYLNNNGGMMRGCLNIGKVSISDEGTTPTYGGAFIGWLRGNTPGNMQGNCWLEGSAPHANGQGAMNETFSFTAEQLPTGAVCYALNSDQAEIGWFQTLGSDEAPVLDPSHGQVYMNGRLHCNGDVYADAGYSNTYSAITQDDHNFVDGYCSYCDLVDEGYELTVNADGYYEIGSANQLRRFAALVNSGTLNAKAVLVSDIDFADLLAAAAARGKNFEWTPIGSWVATPAGSACFQGHFDGQGHAIKNFKVTANQNFYGLFGVISTDCLIENFSVEGEINTAFQYTGGVAAYSRDDRPAIRNVHSYVNINNSYAGGRQAGILGGAHSTTYKTVIENCTYSGKLYAEDAGGSGNYGGIVGYANSNSNTIIDITNCLFDGEVVNTSATPGTCTFGGFVGYINSAVIHIKNCMSIGTVQSQIAGQFLGIVKNTNCTIVNSYYQGDMVNGIGSGSVELTTQEATEVADEQLASGEICWLLNEENFCDVAWHQVLDDQQYPVLDGDAIVYAFGGNNYMNLTDELLADLISDVIAREEEYIGEVKAYQPLLDAYEAEVKSWEGIATLEEFLEAYRASAEMKESINASAASYAAYAQACETAANYIVENNLEGEMTDFLKAYLEENISPNASYPNGSYPYIMDELNLDDEALTAEVAFLNQMLENAIAGGITSGTEITRLLKNASFAEGYEGWAVEADGGTATVGGKPEIMPIPEGYNNKSFSASQTLNEMPNGIYMMTLGGLFRTGGDIYSTFYAGQLYLNETYNYFMSPGEDVVSEEEAEPGVNCIGESSDKWYEGNDIAGWVPQVREGCSVAFSAGRYENLCATEVTDGTLTVGVRNLGTGLSGDWLPFGNLHIYYLGTADEADQKLSDVLEGFKNRAQVIVDSEWTTEDGFQLYPNMSGSLKEQLIDAIAQVELTTDKMALINTFSDLFNQVHACRMAYIAMLDASIKLYDTLDGLSVANLISPDAYWEWESEIEAAQTHFIDGDVSTDEALAIAEKLAGADIMPQPVDGVYQLKTAADLAIFAMIVNGGDLEADAVLTSDIDFADLGDDFAWSAIGNWNASGIAYKGHFDGQGHTISNFTATSDRNFFGLFGVLSDNALIENFNITGDLYTTYQSAGGVAGFARDNNVVIRDIHCYVNIHNTSVGGRQGGILGCSNDGTIRIERCTYSGTFESNDNGNGGNYGGIVGYTNNSTNAVCNITDCLFDGELYNTADIPGNCTFGGMVGYTNASFVTITNCLSIGSVRSARYAQFFGALNGTNSKIFNSYYKGDYVNGSSSGQQANPQETTQVSDTQLASGEVCFKLNGDQSEINWYQTIATDDYPVLSKAGHLQVWFYNDIYTNVDPDGISDIQATEQPVLQGIYNLAGQRLQKMQKGINIVNGKKILK